MYIATPTLALYPEKLVNFRSQDEAGIFVYTEMTTPQTYRFLALLRYEISKEASPKERENKFDPSLIACLAKSSTYDFPELLFLVLPLLGRQGRLLTPSFPSKARALWAAGRRQSLLPGPEALAVGNPHGPEEPRSHCAAGADRSCQGAAQVAPPAGRRVTAQHRPPALPRPRCGPRSAAPGERPAGPGPLRSRAGAMLQTKMAAPGREPGSGLRRYRRSARRTSPRYRPRPTASSSASGTPRTPLAQAALPPHAARGPAPGAGRASPRSPRPRVPGARPAPPPSAPSPSRSEPTRAGCSAGSPGWCSAGAGTARRGPPPPDRPGPRGPGAAAVALLLRQLQPPRSPHPTAGSCSHPPAAAAAAVSGRPPSHRLLRLLGARPLSAGSPPPRPAAGARSRGRGGGERRWLGRGGGGGPGGGAAPSGSGCQRSAEPPPAAITAPRPSHPPTRPGGERAAPAGKPRPGLRRRLRRPTRLRGREVSAAPGGSGTGLGLAAGPGASCGGAASAPPAPAPGWSVSGLAARGPAGRFCCAPGDSRKWRRGSVRPATRECRTPGRVGGNAARPGPAA